MFGLVWLTSNRMFGLVDFGDRLPLWHLNFESTLQTFKDLDTIFSDVVWNVTHIQPSYAWIILATLLHEMGPPKSTKKDAQLNRQRNDFTFTEIKLVYCLRRKTLWCNSLVQKICMLLQKKTSHYRTLGPRGPISCSNVAKIIHA